MVDQAIFHCRHRIHKRLYSNSRNSSIVRMNILEHPNRFPQEPKRAEIEVSLNRLLILAISLGIHARAHQSQPLHHSLFRMGKVLLERSLFPNHKITRSIHLKMVLILYWHGMYVRTLGVTNISVLAVMHAVTAEYTMTFALLNALMKAVQQHLLAETTVRNINAHDMHGN